MPGTKRKAEAVVKKKQLPKLVKQIQVRNAEQKTFSYTCFPATLSAATYNIVSFLAGPAASGNGIAQGSDFNQRIGDRIRIRAIHYTILIVPAAVMPDANGSFCRVIVYHNKQANGALPAANTIFLTDEANSLRNPLYRNRLSVLKDITHQMVVTGTNAAANLTSGPEFFGTFSIYPKQEISYIGTDGEIDTVLKHDYGIGVVSDTASCCTVTVKCQVVYTDI